MILSDGDLLKLGPSLLDPFNPERVQPASYDLALHKKLQVPSVGHTVDLRKHNPRKLSEAVCIPHHGFELYPGRCVLGSTQETVACPSDLVARVEGKSSLGRLFLAVHVTAGWIDSGFTGQITLEIVNHGPWVVVLWPGMPISQINFAHLTQPCRTPYGTPSLGSHYQGQMGPTPAVGNRDAAPHQIQEGVESKMDR